MLSVLIGIGILTGIVLLWFLLTYWLTPHVEAPNGKARITGSCGDTMELSLRFEKDRVVDTAYWTDGCAYSFNCLYAVAELAKGKTPDEILEIDAELIQESIGGLPADHMHCARLSLDTLYAALEDYMKNARQGKRPSAGGAGVLI